MKIKKMCCFYVSDIHLVTMLLPYINERINESIKIITIFETDMSKSAKKVIDGIRGRKSKELLNIDWKCKNIESLKNLNVSNKLILIKGSKQFIKEVNYIINSKEQKCTLLNCFEMMQGAEELEEILNYHEKVVNTSGEKLPEELFTGYTQKGYKKITL